MKIKIDYVTNSSSTGFIVFIPDFGKLEESLKESKVKMLKEWGNNIEITDEKIEQVIANFQETQEEWGDSGYTSPVHNEIVELLHNPNIGHIFKVIDIGGEGNNFIINMSSKMVIEILEKADWVTKIIHGIRENETKN